MLQVIDARQTRAYQLGYEEGYKMGVKEGRNEVTLDIAKGLLALGWSVSRIAAVTQLPLTKTRKLRLEIK